MNEKTEQKMPETDDEKLSIWGACPLRFLTSEKEAPCIGFKCAWSHLTPGTNNHECSVFKIAESIMIRLERTQPPKAHKLGATEFFKELTKKFDKFRDETGPGFKGLSIKKK